jgi:hypothetical protein
MRTKVIIGALAAVLLSALSTTALAKPSLPIPLPWGIVEKIHEIQRLPGIDIRNRYFGYVTERAHVLWIFGLYIRPVGYAIGVGEPADRKGSLITHERLIAMKRSGMIPADLPPTPSLSIMQYLARLRLRPTSRGGWPRLIDGAAKLRI